MTITSRSATRQCVLLVAAVIAAVLALPGSAAAASLGCGDNSADTEDRSSFNAAILADTNAHRASKGLAALAVDPVLTKAALWKARDLGLRNYFSHEDPLPGGGSRTPWERLTACGWDVASSQRAENIAAGQQSGAAFAAAWIASPGHRANIETAAMRYVGIATAYVPGSAYGTYSVQIFSSKSSGVSAPPALPPSPPTTTQLTLVANGTSVDICPPAAPSGVRFVLDALGPIDISAVNTTAGCVRLSAPTTATPGRTDITYRATNSAGTSNPVTLRVDVESSRTLSGTEPAGTSATATTLRGSSAKITRRACRSKSKYCWYATIGIRLRTSAGAAAAGQRVVVTRRTSTGRTVTVSAVATNDAGVATVTQLLHPPVRGTSAWLARQWKHVGFAFAGTQTYASATARAVVRRR